MCLSSKLGNVSEKKRKNKKTECKTDSDEDKYVEGLEEASTGNAENVHFSLSLVSR